MAKRSAMSSQSELSSITNDKVRLSQQLRTLRTVGMSVPLTDEPPNNANSIQSGCIGVQAAVLGSKRLYWGPSSCTLGSKQLYWSPSGCIGVQEAVLGFYHNTI